MKKAIYIIVSLAVFGLLVIWLFSNKKTAENKVYHYNKKEAILISTDTVALRDISVELSYTGTFEPFREGKVMVESQGKITRMDADLGDIIQKGGVVAQLDNELLRLQMKAVNVQIAGLEKDLKRYTILARADAVQGVQLEKTQLALDAARIQSETILEQIDRTTITAPFTGVVTQKFTELGTVISPPVPLIQLTDISRLKMTLSVPESDLKLFRINQEVDVTADIYPEKNFPGRVIMIGSRGDFAHNYPIQIQLDNTPDHLIKAGMFGSVKITTGNNKMLPSISTKALVGSSVNPGVYVMENNRALLREVTVSQQNDKYAAVSSGLATGEIVVVSGFINLKDRSPVKTR